MHKKGVQLQHTSPPSDKSIVRKLMRAAVQQLLAQGYSCHALYEHSAHNRLSQKNLLDPLLTSGYGENTREKSDLYAHFGEKVHRLLAGKNYPLLGPTLFMKLCLGREALPKRWQISPGGVLLPGEVFVRGGEVRVLLLSWETKYTDGTWQVIALDPWALNVDTGCYKVATLDRGSCAHLTPTRYLDILSRACAAASGTTPKVSTSAT